MNRQQDFSHDLDQRRQAAEARFGRRVAARLTQSQSSMDPDVSERLRFAREQAMDKARAARRLAPAAGGVVLTGGSSAALAGGPAGDDAPWWLRLSSLLPLLLLLAGLMLIDRHYTQAQIEAAAEVDAALLADDLPPQAYSDPGFVEFLRTARP